MTFESQEKQGEGGRMVECNNEHQESIRNAESKRIRVTAVGSLPFEGPAILRTLEGFRSDTPSGTDLLSLADARTRHMVNFQTDAGVDILSEGDTFSSEPGRTNWGSNYIFYFARFLGGVGHAYMGNTPIVLGKIRSIDVTHICDDYLRMQALTDLPVKVSLPGPSTFMRRVLNVYYKDDSEYALDYTKALDLQVKALVAAGCRWIQFDDPHLSWDKDLWSVELIDQVVRNNKHDDVKFIVHMCRGNPYECSSCSEDVELSEVAYFKEVLPKLEASAVDYICVENPFTVDGSFQLDGFSRGVILGLMNIETEQCESEKELIDLIVQARTEVTGDLIVSQNCGLKHLSVDVARQKMNRLVNAAERARNLIAGAERFVLNEESSDFRKPGWGNEASL